MYSVPTVKADSEGKGYQSAWQNMFKQFDPKASRGRRGSNLTMYNAEKQPNITSAGEEMAVTTKKNRPHNNVISQGCKETKGRALLPGF